MYREYLVPSYHTPNTRFQMAIDRAQRHLDNAPRIGLSDVKIGDPDFYAKNLAYSQAKIADGLIELSRAVAMIGDKLELSTQSKPQA